MPEIHIQGAREVADLLERYADALPRAVHAGLDAAALGMAGFVQGQMLSGQALNVRTDRLRSSFGHPQRAGTDEYARVVGSNVEYARVHEDGFHGPVQVREHPRRSPPTKAGREKKRRG